MTMVPSFDTFEDYKQACEWAYAWLEETFEEDEDNVMAFQPEVIQ